MTVNITVHDDGTPSSYYPADEQARNGATDYSVTIENLDTGEKIEGEVTLYAGGQAGCPIDGWCSAPVVQWLRTLDKRSYRNAVSSLASGVGTEDIEVSS